MFPGYAKVQVAIRALQLGEPERLILQSLTWQEFEEFVVHVFTYYDFQVHHRFRFSTNRRFEIDIIARRKPILFCVDCKQYGVRLGKTSVLRTATEEQLLRTKALADHFAQFQADLGCLDWQAPFFLPMLVTMMYEDIQFNDRIPIVPASNLNGFLLGFEEQLDEMYVVQPSSGRQKRLF
jgi:Holliday junction resolvase-like predicted endonuclease